MTPSKPKLIIAGFLIVVVSFFIYQPKQLFKDPNSTILYAEEGELLCAQIAADGQWRFPRSDSIPYRFQEAIILFEDQYFFYHPGFNPISILRAFKQNFQAGKVVSGGSTISMQVIRLARKGKPRTILEKTLEILLAIRLELHFSKAEILQLYASNAPYGGNVVGLEAASWRYYGRESYKLSWSEIATLAVLPNAPSLIFPGKNHDKLLSKRNRLLDKLHQNGWIDLTDLELSKEEPLPLKPKQLPRFARHLLEKGKKEDFLGKKIQSTIDYHLQLLAEDIIQRHHESLSQNQVHNAAAMIVEVESGHIKAYVGNVHTTDEYIGAEVDMITSERSPGSVLKPILYASMLEDGMILPASLVPDVPTQVAEYKPENFDLRYRGAVAADEALAKSFNIPAVRMLQSYGVELFHEKLHDLGFSTVRENPDHYGLTLILGGAEISMWDLANAYSGMARNVVQFPTERTFKKITYHHSEPQHSDVHQFPIEAGASWSTFNALQSVSRPDVETGWEYFTNTKNVAWKTGTSFGYRDAWAAGITPGYVIVVWVGNADGEGRPGLTGIKTAAPLLFDLVKKLPSSAWFQPPHDDLRMASVCKKSGYLSSPLCEETDSILISVKGKHSDNCPYHQLVHLDKKSGKRANLSCVSQSNLETASWFLLPPTQAWYYKRVHSDYKSLPEYYDGCNKGNDISQMAIIYPKDPTSIMIPKEIDGKMGKTIFEVAHSNKEATIFWHVDEEFLGSTTDLHQMPLIPEEGKHILTLIDDQGNTIEQRFEIMSN